MSGWRWAASSFHGRGFFPGPRPPDDPLTLLTTIEAALGLIVESHHDLHPALLRKGGERMPATALTLRLYGALNDFLPPARRETTFTARVEGRPSVKDVIESLGPPHTEVDLILVNGRSVDFGYQVDEGDVIEVYPPFVEPPVSPPIGPRVAVQPPPPAPPRFLLDVHLGRLAAYLRMLGFDTLYTENDPGDEALARTADAEGRILLSRDVGLLKRGAVTHGYFVRATDPARQIDEVMRRFALAGKAAPFSRCLRCNGELAPVAKAEIAGALPTRVRDEYDEFRRCLACGQVYWPGTHYQRMRALIDRQRSPVSPPAPDQSERSP